MTDLELYRIALTKEIQKKINEKDVYVSKGLYNSDDFQELEGQIKGLNQALDLANKMVENK